MRVLFSGLCVGCLAVVASGQTVAPEPIIDPEAYRVYADINYFGSKPVVILQQETVPDSGCSVDHYPSDWRPVLDGFRTENRRARPLLPTLVTDSRVRIVAKSQLERILGRDGPYHAWYWGRFANEFPNADGYYFVSAVGFDPGKTKAYVYAGHVCQHCGSSHAIPLEKIDGRWMPTHRPDVSSCTITAE